MSRKSGCTEPHDSTRWRRLAWFVMLYVASLSVLALAVSLLRWLM